MCTFFFCRIAVFPQIKSSQWGSGAFETDLRGVLTPYVNYNLSQLDLDIESRCIWVQNLFEAWVIADNGLLQIQIENLPLCDDVTIISLLMYSFVANLYLKTQKKVFSQSQCSPSPYKLVHCCSHVSALSCPMSCFTVRAHYFYTFQAEEWDIDSSSPREDGVSTMDN